MLFQITSFWSDNRYFASEGPQISCMFLVSLIQFIQNKWGVFMTLQEFKFLKLVHKLTNKTEQTFYYNGSDYSIHLYKNNEIKLSCNKLSSEVNGIEDSLKTQGYLVLVSTGISHIKTYHLTHKGLHYLQNCLGTLLSFLFKSVLVPIIVAFITALLVSA